jgi:LPS-assembly lipoprotein
MRAGRGLRIVVGAALVALAGCGWRPLYADRETGPADESLRAIRVGPIPERIGQRLEIGLRNALNPSGEPTPQRYLLSTTLSVSRASLGIQSQGLGTRGDTNATATYRLADLKDGKVLQTGTVHATESFDIQANNFSTVVAQDDTDTRLANELRDEIIARLTLFMQRQEEKAAASEHK